MGANYSLIFSTSNAKMYYNKGTYYWKTNNTETYNIAIITKRSVQLKNILNDTQIFVNKSNGELCLVGKKADSGNIAYIELTTILDNNSNNYFQSMSENDVNDITSYQIHCGSSNFIVYILKLAN